MIKTLIVDDEILARAVIRTRLETNPDFEIVAEAADGPRALESIRRLRPDLVLLDVQLPEFDAFTMLEQLSPSRLPAAVVFVTAFDRYAIKAFDSHALDYLLKPVIESRFNDSLNRVRAALGDDTLRDVRRARLADGLRHLGESRLQTNDSRAVGKSSPGPYLERFVVQERDRFFFVRPNQVEWFTTAANYIELHVSQRSHLVRMTMQELEDQLDPSQFVRIHRSTIVNVERIKEVRRRGQDDTVILTDGAALAMSRTYRHRLLS